MPFYHRSCLSDLEFSLGRINDPGDTRVWKAEKQYAGDQTPSHAEVSLLMVFSAVILKFRGC